MLHINAEESHQEKPNVNTDKKDLPRENSSVSMNSQKSDHSSHNSQFVQKEVRNRRMSIAQAFRRPSQAKDSVIPGGFANVSVENNSTNAIPQLHSMRRKTLHEYRGEAKQLLTLREFRNQLLSAGVGDDPFYSEFTGSTKQNQKSALNQDQKTEDAKSQVKQTKDCKESNSTQIQDPTKNPMKTPLKPRDSKLGPKKTSKIAPQLDRDYSVKSVSSFKRRMSEAIFDGWDKTTNALFSAEEQEKEQELPLLRKSACIIPVIHPYSPFHKVSFFFFSAFSFSFFFMLV